MQQEIIESATSVINKFKRNDMGLLDSVKYKFTEDSLVDWRAMIDPKFLFVNKDNFSRRKETPPDDIVGVKDSDLIIGLPGLKNLAHLRGFTSVSYRPITSGNDYSAVVCRIDWVGNFETDMKSVSFEDCAGANLYNVSEFVQTYLIEMATNRSFCRCVRNFLKINIVSKEEMPPPKAVKNNTTASEPAKVLADLMREKGKNFEETMKKLVAEGYAEFANYKNWSEIPGDKAFQLVDRFKNLKGRG